MPSSSADTLAELILRVLRVPSVAEEHPSTALHQVLLSAPPTLLVLDNFETLWDVNSNRANVLDLLQKSVMQSLCP